MQFDEKRTSAGLQQLLAEIYGSERCVIDVLRQFGLPDEQLDILNTEKIAEFHEHIHFALMCRFLHYADGRRLLLLLLRRYGLFGHTQETLQAIGDDLDISRERVRQLENKAIKRLKSGVRADATAILLLLAACRALALDPIKLMPEIENENASNEVDSTALATQRSDLPRTDFYIQSSFDYTIRQGSYRLLMVYGEHEKYFTKHGLNGRSDVAMILTAVIDGLEMLKKPCYVVVYSNTVFGIKSVYRKGKLRSAVRSRSVNYELKEHIRKLLEEHGHVLENTVNDSVKMRLEKIGKEL